MDCSALLVIQSCEPLNAEPPSSALVEFPITPEDLVYCRNHSDVKQFDEDEYELTVIIEAEEPKKIKFPIRALKGAFEKVDIEAALQVNTVRFIRTRNS